MATKPLSRSPGRPLPAFDPAYQNQAHRLATIADIGTLLHQLRAVRRLTQADMAAAMGISRQKLVGMEAGAEGIAAGTLLRILADLGVTVMAYPPLKAEEAAELDAPP